MKLRYQTVMVAPQRDLPFSGGWVNVFYTEACLTSELMATLAKRLDQPESVFVCPYSSASSNIGSAADTYSIKWFSLFGGELYPGGAGTMAAAHILFEEKPQLERILFKAVGKTIEAKRLNDGGTEIILPGKDLIRVDYSSTCSASFCPEATLAGERDLYVIVSDESAVRMFNAELAEPLLKNSRFESVVVTAKGVPTKANWVDFVYRVFLRGNDAGEVFEDPASFSVLSNLATYWSSLLKRVDLTAWQLSSWESSISCRIEDGNVYVRDACKTVGSSVLYLDLLDPDGFYSV